MAKSIREALTEVIPGIPSRQRRSTNSLRLTGAILGIIASVISGASYVAQAQHQAGAGSTDSTSITLVGHVVDSKGEPVRGAEVRAAIRERTSGGVWEPSVASSDADGAFKLEVVLPASRKALIRSRARVSACVSHVGYATTDSTQFGLTGLERPIDVGTVVLKPGYSLSVSVVDSSGSSASGATLSVSTPGTQRFLMARADKDGRATITELPADVVRVTASLGNETTTTKVVVGKNNGRNRATITLRPRKNNAAVVSIDQRIPVAIGKPAPQWDLVGWSDGQNRSLSDYRGKVVAIDFWGLWCGACVSSIPAVKRLVEDYESRGVVFIGIHTADGNLEQINALKKLKQWTVPTGVDRGTSIPDSYTFRAYGVGGAPTWVIVDRDGTIAYRNDIRPKDMDAFVEGMRILAEADDVPWPIPDDGAAEERTDILNKLTYGQVSRELDRVLGPIR